MFRLLALDLGMTGLTERFELGPFPGSLRVVFTMTSWTGCE